MYKLFLILSLTILPIYTYYAPSKDGRFTHFTDIGQGFPILLVPPCPTEAAFYQPNQKGLEKHFRVIAIDLFGFGFSSQRGITGQEIPLSAYAEQIKDVLDYLGIKKAVIGGESLGGMIALEFLYLYPEYISGMILSDTDADPETEEGKVTGKEWADMLLSKNGLEKWMNWFLPLAFPNKVDRKSVV